MCRMPVRIYTGGTTVSCLSPYALISALVTLHCVHFPLGTPEIEWSFLRGAGGGEVSGLEMKAVHWNKYLSCALKQVAATHNTNLPLAQVFPILTSYIL